MEALLSLLLIIPAFLLCYAFSLTEKAISVVNKFQFRQTHHSSSRRFKWARLVLNKSSESLKTSWFGKILFLIILCFLISDIISVQSASLFQWYTIASIVSLFILIDLTSKFIIDKIPEQVIMALSPLIVLFSPLFLFFTKSIESVGAGLSFVLRSDQNLEALFIKQDIKNIVHQNRRQGKELEKDLEIISNVFDIRSVTAKDVMIPRKEIKSIEKNYTLESARDAFHRAQFSRLIVYSENIDNVVGYIQLDDMFKRPSRLSKIIHEVFFIPESRKIFDLFQDFLRSKISTAVVVDEYGATVGIVSLSDLVEEITGDLKGDSGRRQKDIEPPLWKLLSTNEYELSGRLRTDVLKQALDIDVTGLNYETVGGLALHILERIPSEGDKFTYSGFTFTVLSSNQTQVQTLKLQK